MEQGGIKTLIAFVIVLFTLGVFLILLILIFLKRKNSLIREQEAAKRHYKQEIVKTQIEIREETLKNISWELHDNIGQLMTLAKIQVQNAKDNPDKIDEVAQIIGSGLNELRMLSKIINPDVIKNLNLEEAIQLELERFNRLNFIKSTYKATGEKQPINDEAGLVLFRIIQEFFSNTIKHSQATNLDVFLEYFPDKLIISAKDNGKGFNPDLGDYNGIGLKNMKSRAELIKSTLELTSAVNQGTHLQISYNLISTL